MIYQSGDILYVKYTSWYNAVDWISELYEGWNNLYVKGLVTKVDDKAECAWVSFSALLRTYKFDFSYFSNNFVKQNLPKDMRVLTLEEYCETEGKSVFLKLKFAENMLRQLVYT